MRIAVTPMQVLEPTSRVNSAGSIELRGGAKIQMPGLDESSAIRAGITARQKCNENGAGAPCRPSCSIRNASVISRVDWMTKSGGRHPAAEKNFMSKKAAEHHKKASEHLTHAARHHGEAAKHHEAGHHETAAHHAHTAHGHAVHARGHAEEAVKVHVEEHGKK
jgi:hypothetical protein